jgi:hypothetical protein
MSRPAYRPEPLAPPVARLNVFVLLAHGFGARAWSERWSRGELAGIQERLPYGYFHCAEDKCEIRYSEDAAEIDLRNSSAGACAACSAST